MNAGTDAAAQGTRRMLHDAFARLAQDLAVHIDGDPVFGWRDRSIGGPVERAGERLWLRVVWARRAWARGLWWTGNEDASAIAAVRKPAVVEVLEHGQGGVVLRAELMTRVPGAPCAVASVLDARPALDAEWWDALHGDLTLLSRARTTRMALDPDSVRRRVAVFFGHEVHTDVGTWRPAHGDLHWGNLHADGFAIVDWEAWGLAPRGYDAAFLLCHSLAVPEVAAEIVRRFADDLDTDDGVVAQLYAATRLLTRADGGEHPELVIPLHRHADLLIGRSRPSRPLTQGVNL